MRKMYLVPTTEVVRMQMESQVLAGSPGGGGGSTPNEVSAKRNGYGDAIDW